MPLLALHSLKKMKMNLSIVQVKFYCLFTLFQNPLFKGLQCLYEPHAMDEGRVHEK
jgi:hypothetical protein